MCDDLHKSPSTHTCNSVAMFVVFGCRLCLIHVRLKLIKTQEQGFQFWPDFNKKGRVRVSIWENQKKVCIERLRLLIIDKFAKVYVFWKWGLFNLYVVMNFK